jgi:hypothetical protein
MAEEAKKAPTKARVLVDHGEHKIDQIIEGAAADERCCRKACRRSPVGRRLCAKAGTPEGPRSSGRRRLIARAGGREPASLTSSRLSSGR